jgi:hypothetical protein
MASGGKIKGTALNFDPEFRFLLEIDPDFEDWRALAAERYSTQKISSNQAAALAAFFMRYLHALKLDKRPVALFEAGNRLPDLWTSLGLDSITEGRANMQHDTISDFLDWVLRNKLTEPDAEGHWVVPAHLANPFPRHRAKRTGKQSDLSFSYVTALDPRMAHWRELAGEWLSAQKRGVANCCKALDKFLVTYLIDRKSVV